MDYFAHGFWSYILFHWMKKPWRAIAFGLLPDTGSWFIYMIYRIATFENIGQFSIEHIPDWVYTLYNISHSLFVAFAAIFAVYLIRKKLPVYMLAWPAAIVMDLFTHSREFLPTPFLWPISAWRFPGISWGNGYFMIGNYIAIALCFAYIFLIKKKK